MNRDQIIAGFADLGVRVGVFGSKVYLSTSTAEVFRVIADYYHAKTTVVVSTYRQCVAADVAYWTEGEWSFEMQGPTRRPTSLDWARHRRNEEVSQ